MGSRAVIGLGLADGPAGISATTGLATLPEVKAATLHYALALTLTLTVTITVTVTLTLTLNLTLTSACIARSSAPTPANSRLASGEGALAETLGTPVHARWAARRGGSPQGGAHP